MNAIRILLALTIYVCYWHRLSAEERFIRRNKLEAKA